MPQFGHLDGVLRSLAAAALLAPWGAHATLVGVTQTFPDITLGNVSLIYDHNGIDSTTGLLRVVAGSSTLNEGPAAGGSSTTAQSYFASGDAIPDVMLSFRVSNTTGALVGGDVTITMGNVLANPRFSWSGTVNSFGSAAGTGTIFDATWTVSGDQYQNIPTNMSQFVNGFLTGGTGGLKLTSSAAWGSATNFGNDWIYGSSPGSSSLSSYTGSMTTPIQTTSTITADVWAAPAAVPLPGGLWLLGSGVLALWRTARRRPRETKQFISC